jgi:hypothetical protein
MLARDGIDADELEAEAADPVHQTVQMCLVDHGPEDGCPAIACGQGHSFERRQIALA